MDFAYMNSDSMSSAQLRRIRKPIIERRRRERINRCLEQIKSLVLKALHQDESKYEKMDKADILEMAVRHLLDQERAQVNATYRAGYSRCKAEVNNFMQKTSHPAATRDVTNRLVNHLTQNCNKTILPPRQCSPLTTALSVNIPQVNCKLEEENVRCSSAPEPLSASENNLLVMTKPLSPPVTPCRTSLLTTPPPTPVTDNKRLSDSGCSSGDASICMEGVSSDEETTENSGAILRQSSRQSEKPLSSPVWRPW